MNLLFITASRIGDAVLTTGLLDRLVAENPGARVTLACGAIAIGIFDAAPAVVRRIPLVKQPFARHWLGLWRRVAGTRWDLVVDLRGSLLAYLLAARRRRVYRSEGGDSHRLAALARRLGYDPPPPPRLWTTAAHAAAAAALIPAGGPVLALAPTANWAGKIWPAARFVALAERLTGPGAALAGARIAVFGAAAERAIAAPVLAGIAPARRLDLVGRTDLPTAAATLARAALFVGNDSGLMHIAAATGVPTVGLFGPSRPEHYGPVGPRTAVVRTAIPYDKLFPPGYDHGTTGTLMESLSVAAVERAAVALLGTAAAA